MSHGQSQDKVADSKRRPRVGTPQVWPNHHGGTQKRGTEAMSAHLVRSYRIAHADTPTGAPPATSCHTSANAAINSPSLSLSPSWARM